MPISATCLRAWGRRQTAQLLNKVDPELGQIPLRKTAKAGTDDATLTLTPVADTSDYPFKLGTAKSVVLQAVTQSALIAIDGSNPDQTYKKGILVPANTTVTITDPNAIRNLRVIDAVNGSATTVNVTCYFFGPWGGYCS